MRGKGMISEEIKKLLAENSANSNKDLVTIINDIQNLNAHLDDLIFNQTGKFDLGYLTTYDLEEVSKFSNGLPREFINYNLFET